MQRWIIPCVVAYMVTVLRCRTKVGSLETENPIPGAAGNAVPIYNHKHAVFQLAHMGGLKVPISSQETHRGKH